MKKIVVFQLLTQQHQRTASLLKVCDLASSMGNTLLAQVAYSVLNLCPPDHETYSDLLKMFSGDQIPPEVSEDGTPNVDVVTNNAIEKILYNSPAPQVLYNLEVSDCHQHVLCCFEDFLCEY